MGFIGKRIRSLQEVPVLADDSYFIVDCGNAEANKVTVSTLRDHVITPDMVAGSTVEIQMIINAGKKEIVKGLAEHGIEASHLESFQDLEAKVDSIIAVDDDHVYNTPQIYGYAGGDTNLFSPYNIYPYIPVTDVYIQLADNGVVSFYKPTKNASGQWYPQLVGNFTDGQWDTALTDNYCGMVSADGTKFVFPSNVTYAEDTGRCFYIYVISYDTATNTPTYTRYYLSGLSYTGYYDHEIRILGMSPDNKYIFLHTTADSCVIVYDVDKGTYVKGGYTNDNDYFVTNPAYFITNTKIVVPTGQDIRVLEYTGSAINVTGVFAHSMGTNAVWAVDTYTTTDEEGEETEHHRFVCFGTENANGFRHDSYAFDIDTLSPLTPPTIINHTEFADKNYTQPHAARPYNIKTFKLDDDRTLILSMTGLFQTCIYNHTNNTLEYPYITGFGPDMGWSTYANYFSSTWIYLDEDLTGTCYATIPGSSSEGYSNPYVRQIKVLLDIDNTVEFEGNTFNLEKPDA